MERDFLGLNSKESVIVVKEEIQSDSCKDLGYTKGSAIQWPFSNKVSSLPHLMAFKVGQEDKTKKIASEPHMSSGFLPIATSDAFDTSQKCAMAEIQKSFNHDRQGGTHFSLRAYPVQHDMHSVHHPHDVKMFSVSNPAVSVPICNPYLKDNFTAASMKHQLLGGIPVTSRPLILPTGGSIAGITEPWNNVKTSGSPPQLTIFYAGTVNVFDGISPEKAQAIMFLAGNGSSVASNAANLKAQVQAPSSKLAAGDGVPVNQPINTPPSALSSPLSVSSHTGAQSGSGSTSTDELMAAKNTTGVPNCPVSKVEPPKIINAVGSVSTTPMMPSAIPQFRNASLARFLEKRKESCMFQDARQRPDAKTLLSHPWIQNCRRALQSSIRNSGTIRSIQEDVSVDGDHQSSGGSPIAEKVELATSVIKAETRKELISTEAVGVNKSDQDHASDSILDEEKTDNLEDDLLLDQVPTLAIHEKSSLQNSSVGVSSDRQRVPSDQADASNHEVLVNGEVRSPEPKMENGGKESSLYLGSRSFGFGKRNQDDSSQKTTKISTTMGGNELSRFSDTPGDASLDDLFHPLDKLPEDRGMEASTSASTSRHNQGNAGATDPGKNDLATKLRATIAQKQMENENGQANGGGGNLLRLMMGVLKDDVIDIDGLVFDEKLPGENLFPLQAVEFSRLVGCLRPEESEDGIASACQKLIAIFHQRPEQKIVFVTQHGLLPLMELLEVPKTRVICSVLQIINQLIKDNTDFQENACLVGLIPVVMSFAVPDRPREIRMEAAYFLQQLCQSSPLTLQMFIACRGIPVLVGFLEADYAKYREMIHLAIDGMWQVFKLQRSTPRNDFCRIAAKNGILLRLINTLYSLNEATRLASISVGGGFPLEGSSQRPRSGQLDSSHPIFVQIEASFSATEQVDLTKVRHGIVDNHFSTVTSEPSRASVSHSQRVDGNQSDLRYHVDADRTQSSNGASETSVPSKLPDPSLEKVANLATTTTSKERENIDRWKIDPSRADVDLRQQRVANSANRTSTDRPPKLMEGASNGFPTIVPTQQEQVRPLLSLLDKEPPSRHFSGQLEYVRHLSGLERHESILPLLHTSNERKTNGELDFLMAEFADVSQRGRESGNVDATARISNKTVNKKIGPLASNEGAASTSGIASQTASGVLSGSGVLNARPGSATSSGLLSHVVSTMNTDVARDYLEKVADLLLEFAQADTTVKPYMCSQSLLSRLFQMFNRVEPPILLKILKCINHLSTDPNCLENLQRADAIKYLIPNLELKEGSLVSQIHHEVLNALFNLCKINKRRQEQAAENGIIPHLMRFIESDSPLKQYALPLLCDMAHASRNSREQLRAHGGLDVYLSLLEDEVWSVTALDSIAVCLAHDNDNRKVEQALLKKDAVQKLVMFFQCCPEQHFVHILEPFLKIITKSSRINTTLAVNGLTPLLIARLDHQDAIARLNLLKLIKAVYEHHPRPKQLIVENDLPQKLQDLIEERRDGQRSGGQVLVKQMATSLLKALHINTVL